MTWTAPSDGFVLSGGYVQIEYQLVPASGPAGPWNGETSIDPGVTQYLITGLQIGQQYNVQLRFVNSAGVPSNWTVAGPQTVTVSTDAGLPPSATFSADASIAGSIRFSNVAFTASSNLNSLYQIQFGVYYPSPVRAGRHIGLIGSPFVVGSTDTAITISQGALSNYSGRYILLDDEIIGLGALVTAGAVATYNCTRGMKLSTAAAHASGAPLVLLAVQTFTYTFQPYFWAASAVGGVDWSATEIFPSETVYFVDFLAYNGFGFGPVTTNNYETTGQGSSLVTTAASGGSGSIVIAS